MRLWLLVVMGCASPRPTHTEVVHDPKPVVHWCIDLEKCDASVHHCLDICYKYNHPNGPKNDACDRNCREAHCGRVVCK